MFSEQNYNYCLSACDIKALYYIAGVHKINQDLGPIS